MDFFQPLVDEMTAKLTVKLLPMGKKPVTLISKNFI